MKKFGLLSLAFLIMGLSPYIIWRQDVIFLKPFKPLLPHQWVYHGNVFEKLLINHFSDLMWYLSLLFAQYSLTKDQDNYLIYCAYALPFICEIGQLFGIFPGTFDFIDIAVYLLTLILYLVWKRKIWSKQPKPSVS